MQSFAPVIGAVLVFGCTAASGQAARDTTASDSIRAVPPPAAAKSPAGAMLRSALIPGWGQWYADQKIRAAIAFGGVAGCAGTAVIQNQMAVRSPEGIERDFYRDNRSRALWWCAGVYLLSLLDAYVDAHLWHFDTEAGLAAAGLARDVPGPRIAIRLPLSRIPTKTETRRHG